MNIIRYIFLGIIQGFTEPTPISSSGHILLLRHLFNFRFIYDLNFEIIVNFGSLIAVIYFYRKELLEIFNDFILYIKTRKNKYKENYNYVWLVVVGTIPAAILGLIYKDGIEAISSPKTVGLYLLLTAALLFIARNIKGKKDDNNITIKDALFIGFYQVIALIPGVSRSGATLVGGLFRNLKRETAFRFSFMLYIPVSIGAMILGMNNLIHSSKLDTLWFPYLFGMIASGIVTYYALRWFKNIVLKGKLIYFVYYTAIVGLIAILFIK